MSLFKSSNPALNVEMLSKIEAVEGADQVMTMKGTLDKIGILAILVLMSATISWQFIRSVEDVSFLLPYFGGGAILAFITGLVIIFNKTSAPYLAPIYCVLQGFLLGTISLFMNETFPGIVSQAIVLTFTILFSVWVLYRYRIIKVTAKFELIVASATLGICMYYLAALVGAFCGIELPYIHESTTGGIVFSLVVTAIASLNLVLDFDFIEKGVKNSAPKYMEWYGAFGLMVTIIWLYLEILRLLGKLKK